MAKARTRQKRPTCNLPGCDRPVKCRGLCAGCYFYLQRGKDPERRAALEAVAEPPKRRTRPGLREGSVRLGNSALPAPTMPKPDVTPGSQAPDVVGDAQEAAAADRADEGGNLDDVIATVCEVCTALGIKHFDKPGTRHFHNDANGKTVELTDGGRVYHVELRRTNQVPVGESPG